jgi:hypothetical protein
MENEMKSGSANEPQMRFLACKIREHQEHLLQLCESRCDSLDCDFRFYPLTRSVANESIDEIHSYDFMGICNTNESVFRTYDI